MHRWAVKKKRIRLEKSDDFFNLTSSEIYLKKTFKQKFYKSQEKKNRMDDVR